MNVKESFLKKKVAKNFNCIDVANNDHVCFKNELKSTMNINCPSSNGVNKAITGTYSSKVGTNNHSNHLTGFISNNIISFTVNYTQEGSKKGSIERSIAAWTGQFVYNTSSELWEIHTLWHLVEQSPPNDIWENTNAGYDIFTQVKCKTK